MTVLIQALLEAHQMSHVKVITHEGKSDLEKSFPRKIGAWLAPDTRFVVARDQDHATDCTELKAELTAKIPASAQQKTKVRIVCRELEAWYLGDFPALAKTGYISLREAKRLGARALYRDPDAVINPKQELKKIVKPYSPLDFARRVGPNMIIDQNRSRSFRHFTQALGIVRSPSSLGT